MRRTARDTDASSRMITRRSLMMGGAMMITAWIIAKRRNFPRQAWMGWGGDEGYSWSTAIVERLLAVGGVDHAVAQDRDELAVVGERDEPARLAEDPMRRRTRPCAGRHDGPRDRGAGAKKRILMGSINAQAGQGPTLLRVGPCA